MRERLSDDRINGLRDLLSQIWELDGVSDRWIADLAGVREDTVRRFRTGDVVRPRGNFIDNLEAWFRNPETWSRYIQGVEDISEIIVARRAVLSSEDQQSDDIRLMATMKVDAELSQELIDRTSKQYLCYRPAYQNQAIVVSTMNIGKSKTNPKYCGFFEKEKFAGKRSINTRGLVIPVQEELYFVGYDLRTGVIKTIIAKDPGDDNIDELIGICITSTSSTRKPFSTFVIIEKMMEEKLNIPTGLFKREKFGEKYPNIIKKMELKEKEMLDDDGEFVLRLDEKEEFMEP